jgi:hypothetical protein
MFFIAYFTALSEGFVSYCLRSAVIRKTYPSTSYTLLLFLALSNAFLTVFEEIFMLSMKNYLSLDIITKLYLQYKLITNDFIKIILN